MNIIGAGNVGRTLGKLLHHHIQSICNQSLASGQAACDFIGAGVPVSSLNELPPADITLIAVPDQAIQSVCEAWVQTPAATMPGSIVFHVSGAFSSNLLDIAREKGLYAASIHPLKSFASPSQAYETFSGTFCAAEGDRQALDCLTPLFQAIGGQVGEIQTSYKALYHAACVMACGGLTALYATCENILKEAGLSDVGLAEYMKQTIDNNARLGSTAALTGPVKRGDEKTIAMHQAALSGQVRELYNLLTQLQRDALNGPLS